MKHHEFQKQLIAAIKSLKVYSNNLAIDQEQANQLMQEILQHSKPMPQGHKERATSNEEDCDTLRTHELQMAITSLPDNTREVFALYILGYKYHEIAELLHIPTGTVKSRIYAVEKGIERIQKE
jgi:RNA polymerase sigma-70 factor (ECF subfamily)